MTMSNSNVAESRLSCHTTSFAVCDWHLLVSYRTLAVAVAQHKAVWLVKFTRSTSY